MIRQRVKIFDDVIGADKQRAKVMTGWAQSKGFGCKGAGRYAYL